MSPRYKIWSSLHFHLMILDFQSYFNNMRAPVCNVPGIVFALRYNRLFTHMLCIFALFYHCCFDYPKATLQLPQPAESDVSHQPSSVLNLQSYQRLFDVLPVAFIVQPRREYFWLCLLNLTDMPSASLISVSPVHVCCIDGDSESHTALDLKLVLPSSL